MTCTRKLLVGFVSLSIIVLIKAQTTPPLPVNPGCPPPPDPFPTGSKNCFAGGVTCRATKGGFPSQFKSRGQIYRTFRTRSWWFCGKACDPTTLCQYWTFRPKTRQCYLLKSCCFSERKGFQSGKAGECPVDA